MPETSLGLVLLAASVCASAPRRRNPPEGREKALRRDRGYEDNMFKVKTDYGFVLVEKDKIASIIPDTPANPVKSERTATAKPAAKTERCPAKKENSLRQRRRAPAIKAQSTRKQQQ